MESDKMKRGFTLIEVMIALCMLMICIVASLKMCLMCSQAMSYGEKLTRATMMASTMLQNLRYMPFTMEDLNPGWHSDQDNPHRNGGTDYSRFWTVTETASGKDVRMFVAWADKGRPAATNFRSQLEMESNNCPHIDLRELILKPE